MVFLGTFKHNLDVKNRLTLPSKFTNKLLEKVVVSKGFDGCLELRSIAAIEKYADELMNLSQTKKDTRIVVRQLLANAADLEIDKANRILMPTNLLLEANLTKEVIIIGIGNKIEIWDAIKYEEFKNATDATYESIAEKLEKNEI